MKRASLENAPGRWTAVGWALALALPGVGPPSAVARAGEPEPQTLKVPSEYADVQAALTAARDGDTVLVAPGTYEHLGPLSFEGKKLRLVSEAGLTETTLKLLAPVPLDGRDDPLRWRGSVLIFENAEPEGSLVRGFTIRDGRGTHLDYLCRGELVYDYEFGGGVLVLEGASVTFENCRLTGNESNGGGGIACYGGSVVLRDCSIGGNTAWVTEPGTGGGVLCMGGGEALLERCSVGGNYAQHGGGLSLSCGSKVTMVGGSIGGNDTNENGSGGGVACWDSELFLEGCRIERNCTQCIVAAGLDIGRNSLAVLRNCTIEDHSADDYGGGIVVRFDAIAHIEGSILRGNASTESGAIDCRLGGHVTVESSILAQNWGRVGAAGALRLEPGCSAVLRDCLIFGNVYGGVEALQDTQLEVVNCTFADNCEYGLYSFSEDPQLTVRNSILWRNGYPACGGGVGLGSIDMGVKVSHSLIQGESVWPGEGNTNVDPLFGDPFTFEVEDYRLPPGSPAIDAGSSAGIRDTDLDGNPRVCGAAVDLGPFELGDCEPPRFRRGDADGSGALELTDALAILGYLFQGSAAPACLDSADVQDSGELDVADAVHLLLHLYLGGPSPPPPGDDCGEDSTVDTVSCFGRASDCGERG